MLSIFKSHFWLKTLAVIGLIVAGAALWWQMPEPGSSASVKQPAPEAQSVQAGAQSFKTLVLSPEAIQNAGISWHAAGPADIQQTRRFPGEIAVDQHRYKRVSARFGGTLKTLYFHAGETVKAGAVVALLQSPELADLRLSYLNQRSRFGQQQQRLLREKRLFQQTQQLIRLLKAGKSFQAVHQQVLTLQLGHSKGRLLSAYSQLQYHHQVAERERQLAQEHLNTAQEALQTEQAYQQALTEYTAALEQSAWEREEALLQQQLAFDTVQQELRVSESKLLAAGEAPATVPALPRTQLSHYLLKAPISGVILTQQAVEGSTVQAEAPVFELADLGRVWAEIKIYSQDLPQIRLGLPVRIWGEQGQQLNARIDHFKPLVDPQTRTAEAHAEIANPGRTWLPGMFVSIEVTYQTQKVALAVENTALQQIEGQQVVFVKTPAGVAVRPVKLGQQGHLQTEVLAGLKAGEQVAVKNSFVLKSAYFSMQER